MSFSVRVIRDDLSPAVRRLRGGLLQRHMLEAARSIAVEVLTDLVGLVPVDTGAYQQGWEDAIGVLEGGGESPLVSVFDGPGVVGVDVANPEPYGVFIELGTSRTPAGNHVALAVSAARRSPRVLAIVQEALQDAWEAAT